MTLLALATALRALADQVHDAAGKRQEVTDEASLRRHALLRGIASELHRLGRLVETYVERGGA